MTALADERVSTPILAARDQRQSALPFFGWLLVVLLVLAPFKLVEVSLPLTSDQGVYSTMAQHVVLRGNVPYRDAWEVKPPGIFYARAAVLSLVPNNWLRPCVDGPITASCPWMAIQVADFLAMATFAALAMLIARLFGFAWLATGLTAVLATVGVSLVQHSQLGFTPEKLALVPSTAALYCALRGRLGSSAWWVLSGVLIGLATLTMQTTGTVLLPIVAVALLQDRWRARRILFVLAGMAAVLALVSGYMASQGALVPMLEDSLFTNVRRITSGRGVWSFEPHTALRDAWQAFRGGLAPLWLVGGIGLVALLYQRPKALLPLVVWGLVDSAATVYLRQPLLSVPSLSLAGGWLLASLWWAARSGFGVGHPLLARLFLAATLGTLVVVTNELQVSVFMRARNERIGGNFVQAPGERIGASLRSLPDGPLMVWGNSGHLYLYANRPPATRYLHTVAHLGTTWPTFEESRAELMVDLQASAPPVVVVQDAPEGEDWSIEGFPELLAYLEQGYERRPRLREAREYQTWVRKDLHVSQ